MSYALSVYLESGFTTVIFASVVVIGAEIRNKIFQDITATDFEVIAFTLKCSEETLSARHKYRGDLTEVSFEWLNLEPLPGDHFIQTDGKTPAQVAKEIRAIIDTK